MVKSKPALINYSQLNQELAELMATLEQGDLDVDQAVASYDRGLQIITVLESQLLQAENTVTRLKARASELDSDEEE